MIDAFVHADGFTHILAFLVLLSRIGDVVSTRLVTPTLRLEANPIVRRLGWRFAASTLLVAAIPYVMLELGVVVLTTSLLVAGSNFSRGWLVHALGEAEYEDLLLRAASRGNRRVALGFILAGAAHVAAAGVVLMWLSTPNQWGFYSGFGVLSYGVVVAIHGSLFVVRLFRRVGR
jgi:hypothetical protein